MITELYTFPDTEHGLILALKTTLTLRAFGFRTRLATRYFGHGTTVQSVIAIRPTKPTRAERGCNL